LNIGPAVDGYLSENPPYLQFLFERIHKMMMELFREKNRQEKKRRPRKT